jgi:capsular polysaccharide biosynthesis protein
VPITDAPIAVNAKNFCYLNLKYVTSKKQIQRLSKEFIGAARERAQEPTKKIYLSRRAAVEALIKTFNEPVDITKYPSYRIDDEAELEDFFKSNGYEIVYPEDFNSMEEQISYMQQVKVFVSISGSGFLNQLFMNSDTHVMELMPESDLPSQILKFIEALDQEFYLVQHNGVAKDLINTLMNDVNFQYITSMGTND